jgi:transposase-like protein
MGRARTRFTLVEKEDIVAVAYSNPGKVKATARTYGVQPKDMRSSYTMIE